MNKKMQLIAAVLLIFALAQAVQAQDFSHMEAILERIDAQSRFDGMDFSCVLTMIVEDPEEGIEKLVVRQFRRDDGERYLLRSRACHPKGPGISLGGR